MESIKWGIIGCGDVTEVKSGPAFNKVKNSSLVAVMRRDGEKAKDYASRHNVPKWYTDANQLINDPEINAVYVATPPQSHEEYTIAALQAGKPVYVEKPMALNTEAAVRMMKAAKENISRLSIAHYRREQPMFKKIKQLLDDSAIGKIKFADLRFLKPPLTNEEIEIPKTKWRIDPSIAGGGLFHDLAPHQIDLMIYFLGNIKNAKGISANQEKAYKADDTVSGTILFESGAIFSGLWCFTIAGNETTDHCEITGSTGEITFSIFDNPVINLTRKGKKEIIEFEKIPHVQQPMIEKVVDYFLDNGPNPCSAEEGVRVMEMIEAFTKQQAVSSEQ